MQDKMMKDINMPPSGSSLDFSSGKMHSYSNPNQKLAAVRYCMQHDGHGSQINSLLGERSIFNDLENGKEDIWDGSLQFTFYSPFSHPLLLSFVVAITS